MFYVVALVALLQWEQFKPQPYAPASSAAECHEIAGRFNEQFKDELKEEENVARGLRFVCLKVDSDT